MQKKMAPDKVGMVRVHSLQQTRGKLWTNDGQPEDWKRANTFKHEITDQNQRHQAIKQTRNHTSGKTTPNTNHAHNAAAKQQKQADPTPNATPATTHKKE